MKKRTIKLALIIVMIFHASFLFAQFGGDQSFDFLNLPVGARSAALGGVIASSTADDVNLFVSNPALLDSANDNHLSWSYFTYYADVKLNTISYAKQFDKIGMVGLAVQRVGYGTFDRYDDLGNSNGTFDAHETAVVVSHSHTLGLFTMGANLKYINSGIDTYSSHALSMDIGGVFMHPVHELQMSLLVKNIGVVLSEFSGTSNSSLPFDVQLGLTIKPEHMPFRFSVTAYNLTQLQGDNYDPEFDEESGVGGKIFRHINIGTELILGKNVNLRVGYNYNVRQELKLDNVRSMNGISLGFMIKIKAFELSYAFTNYHVSGGRSYFTLTSNLNTIFKKKSIL